MATGLPLSTLLSQVLVAFTIEFDNEFERQMPHRTTRFGATGSGASPGPWLVSPWLVSMVMWSNFMQYVGESGVTVGELERLARVPKPSLSGMERWGYVTVELKKGRSQSMIRPTAKGRMAQDIWRPLFGVIEKRWDERFGKDQIDKLRESLSALAGRLDVELPDYLPVLGFGLCTEVLIQKRVPTAVVGGELPALLSKVLLAFTLDFEREFDLSLPMCADVLRVLDEAGVRVRDLPRLAGVSKEVIKTALGFLAKRRLITPGLLVSLTPKGRLAQEAYRKRISAIEELWRERFGNHLDKLRASLEPLVGEPLFLGLTPHAEGWRASVPKPETLPHYPMVLHRGGYPDGS